jgi:hypothetical protein
MSGAFDGSADGNGKENEVRDDWTISRFVPCELVCGPLEVPAMILLYPNSKFHPPHGKTDAVYLTTGAGGRARGIPKESV